LSTGKIQGKKNTGKIKGKKKKKRIQGKGRRNNHNYLSYCRRRRY
jgi:hypothetical protein